MKKKIKVHSLTGRITPELMRKAFQAVKQNRGAAGVDKVSIQMFAANLEENLTALMRELKTGTFKPLPLRRRPPQRWCPYSQRPRYDEAATARHPRGARSRGARSDA